MSELPNDHWVTRGYQQNFADDQKRVAVLDVALAKVVDRTRPIKSNFRERGFTTFLEEGVPNSLLEKSFASVERSAINQIRLVVGPNLSDANVAAVANLFAVHLVRSPSFKAFHSRVAGAYGVSDEIKVLASSPQVVARFAQDFHRPPEPGELEAIVESQYAAITDDPMLLVQAMMRQHDLIAERLVGLHAQVVTQSPGLPGFAVGDTPIVHMDLNGGRIGFGDSLALMDSTTIVGPISRRVAILFTSRPAAPARFRTHRQVDALNAVFIRAAQKEVACHPDDSPRLERVAQKLDNFPPSMIFES